MLNFKFYPVKKYFSLVVFCRKYIMSEITLSSKPQAPGTGIQAEFSPIDHKSKSIVGAVIQHAVLNDKITADVAEFEILYAETLFLRPVMKL
jgi:hypothetical protein